MATEETIALTALVGQTTQLVDVCTNLKDNVSALIATAVLTSENAALIPLVVLTRNQVDLSTLVINLIVRG